VRKGILGRSSACSDAFPLLREVDGVITVKRLGRAPATVPSVCASSWTASKPPVLGIVANAVKLSRRKKYGYGC
jgi:Mrp family chromosome partitioning ATPase